MKAEVEFPAERKLLEIKRKDGETELVPRYYAEESIKGVVKLKMAGSNKKVEHHGVSITLIGQIGE